MKSKILALSKNEEFKKLLQQKKVSNKYVTIYFGYLNNKNKNRFNISFVTKKKIGNAVKRNKIKRRLRNIMNDAFKKIFTSKNLHENLNKINGEYKGNDLVAEVIKFISKDKKRPICTPLSE